MTPFELVYRVEAQFSLPLELAALNMQKAIEDGVFYTPIEKHILYLQKIEEERRDLVDHITNHQARVKNIFDWKVRTQNFMKGHQVLLWDKRKGPKGVHTKFKSLFKGPFIISKELGSNAFKLQYLTGEDLSLSYNGQDIKLYQF